MAIGEEEEENFETKKGIKILPIGIGQGGSKLTQTIGIKNDCKSKCVYINTSTSDINGLELSSSEVTRTISIGARKGDYKKDKDGNILNDAAGNPIPIEEIDGAGKDRKVSYEYFKMHVREYVDDLKRFLFEEPYDIIYLSFSTAGGTGSGIGPKLTKVLNSISILDEIEKHTGKRPIVYGVAELPELDSSKEGSISYENTLEALKEIDEIVNPADGSAPLARFLFINNNYGKAKYSIHSDQLDNVNIAVADIIKRYIAFFGTSRRSILDRSDRLNAMKVMGIHSFMSFNGDGDRVESPFIVPDGERVKRCCYEVPEKAEAIVSSVIAKTGCGYDDIVHGFYESETMNPIIAFHGFRNVSKIAEQYDKRLKQLHENQSRIEADNIYSATGLDDVANEAKRRESEYGAAGAVGSVEDIF
jgi:cell division GTPase FtsZ